MKLKWKFSTNRPVLSSPLVYDVCVYVGSLDWYMYAIDAQAGWLVWKQRTDGMISSSPAISESLGLVYIGTQKGSVYAFDYTKGRIVWTFTETQGAIGSSPVVTDEFVYIGSSDGYLYCLDARSGDLIWKFNAESGIVSTPAVWENLVFTTARNGRVYALLR
jgi:outer membrane protein assembly factor BamB